MLFLLHGINFLKLFYIFYLIHYLPVFFRIVGFLIQAES